MQSLLKKKRQTYGGQLHAWMAFLIGMDRGKGGRISVDICIDPLIT